ncbi:MAG: response regulator [Proteobacteria bacterium]|nr:response regulator [Pseudomonadota bacterium]MBU1582632.1 response regulator [Pseudomonadota bacterium]MBU2453128.1 response regulator [Pseudomonadota bacterium]MBU2630687.1 response regulator [Pseudomonadota bacterium]
MQSEYRHRVLVVDDDEQIGKTIGRILQTQNIESVFADSGESGLVKIEKTTPPFSIIISDQRMTGMTGIQFLEQAKKLTPDSIRFLLTGYLEMETLINAVNKGSIQRYIAKPWEHDDVVTAIRSGILLYEKILENENLLTLAKKQNAKLYELNCELMETTKGHNKQIHELDTAIDIIEKQIKALSSQKTINPEALLAEIENKVKEGAGIDFKKTEAFFTDTIKELYGQFTELAQRSGFEMPEMQGEIK